MKRTKLLPFFAIAMSIIGVALRTTHFLSGFDAVGLPLHPNVWSSIWIAFALIGILVSAWMARPLTAAQKTPFEDLFGTENTFFRMTAVIVGFLLVAGGIGYFYLTFTIPELNTVLWAQIMEYLYAILCVLSGLSCIGLAKAQSTTITDATAKLTIVPLFWVCAQLLIAYRMSSTDPNLLSFVPGLFANILLAVAFYHFARLLYGKPAPASFAMFSVVAIAALLANTLGYGISWMLHANTVIWSAKTVLRESLSAVSSLLLLAELFVLTGKKNTPQ